MTKSTPEHALGGIGLLVLHWIDLTSDTVALSFLAPIVGIVAGAIAIPGLLAMYFLRLRRRPVRISSTMLWREAVQDLQVNAPFRMIRPSWLLLMQLLALLCFVVASARPTISLAGGASERVILLIDRSASMLAEDAGGGYANRLEEAKARATEIALRASDSGAEVMVVAYGSGARTVSAFTSDSSRLRQTIGAITGTDQPGDLNGALRVVEAFTVGQTEEESWSPARVVLLSDGSISVASDDTPVTLGRATAEFVRVGPEPGGERDNIGIVAFSARRDFEDPGVVRVFARLQSQLRREVSVGVSLLIDGERVESRVVQVAGATDAVPGEATVLFEIRRSEGGVLEVRLGREDVLAADDSVALSLRSHGSRRILLVQGAGVAGGDGAGALLEALRTLDVGEVEVVSIGEFERRYGIVGAIDGVDLIVFDRARPGDLPPTATLSMGSGLPLAGLGVERVVGVTREVAFWLRSHPVIRPADLGNILLGDPGVITAPAEGMRIGGSTVESETLASTRDGALIVLLEQGAIRRLVFGIDLEMTNWWRDRSFPVVIANSVDFLTLAGEGEAGRSWQTSDAVVFRAPAGLAALRIEGPGGFSREVPVSADGSAALGMVERAGLYRVLGLSEGRSDEVRSLAVNVLDPLESSLATRERIEIGGRTLETQTGGAGPAREIWQWFVGVGLVLLVVEWLLFSAKVRV